MSKSRAERGAARSQLQAQPQPLTPTPLDAKFQFNPDLVKKQIVTELHNCQRRGLLKSCKWLSELSHAMTYVKLDSKTLMEASALVFDDPDLYDTYCLCKSFFDSQEYQRCAYFAETSSSKNPLLRFLRFYALYLDGEKKRLESMCELTVVSDPKQMEDLYDLQIEIVASYDEETELENYDAYDLYLMGMIARRQGNIAAAKDFLVASLKANSFIWGSWVELAFLLMDRTALAEMESALPDCWMKFFFLGHIYLELHMNEKAIRIYQILQQKGFCNSHYIKSQIAIAYHNVQRVDEAIESFDQLTEEDPFRLDDMDLYSNMLYVKGEKYYLQVLANKAFEIDKYRVETCCIVGNLHSLKREHHKAIEYFERALRINPYYLSAWTLMGHEFMELKNSNAAIQCYREAVEVNRHDYRAWNGLGQTYDILKMPAYSLYYYKQAHHLRPNDSRLLTALGEAYEKLDKTQNAAQCYQRARKLGDIEGLAILKLAKMQRLSDPDRAAQAYKEYISEMESQNVSDRDEIGKAHIFLSNYYYVHKRDYDASYQHAFKCLEYPEVKDEAKAMLIKIAKAKEPVAKTEPEPTAGTTTTPGSDQSATDMDISTNLDPTTSATSTATTTILKER